MTFNDHYYLCQRWEFNQPASSQKVKRRDMEHMEKFTPQQDTDVGIEAHNPPEPRLLRRYSSTIQTLSTHIGDYNIEPSWLLDHSGEHDGKHRLITSYQQCATDMHHKWLLTGENENYLRAVHNTGNYNKSEKQRQVKRGNCSMIEST